MLCEKLALQHQSRLGGECRLGHQHFICYLRNGSSRWAMGCTVH
jgi:hypothetical protein